MKLVELTCIILFIFQLKHSCDALNSQLDVLVKYPRDFIHKSNRNALQFVQNLLHRMHERVNSVSHDEDLKLLAFQMNTIEQMRASNTRPSLPEYWLLLQG